MPKPDARTNTPGPNFQALGIKSPMEVIDILSLLKVDGEPIIKDDKAFLDPKAKANAVVEYFSQNFGVSAKELPYVASVIKQNLKSGKLNWRN
jgi:hypothetical protein